MHPTELILNDIKQRLENSVANVKSVLWVDAKLDEDDLPLLMITSDGEVIEDYHNSFYIVELDVEIKHIAIDKGFKRHTEAFLNVLKDADAIIKRLSDRLNSIMTVDETATSEMTEAINLQHNLLVASRNYRIKYKRTRGLQ